MAQQKPPCLCRLLRCAWHNCGVDMSYNKAFHLLESRLSVHKTIRLPFQHELRVHIPWCLICQLTVSFKANGRKPCGSSSKQVGSAGWKIGTVNRAGASWRMILKLYWYILWLGIQRVNRLRFLGRMMGLPDIMHWAVVPMSGRWSRHGHSRFLKKMACFPCFLPRSKLILLISLNICDLKWSKWVKNDAFSLRHIITDR